MSKKLTLLFALFPLLVFSQEISTVKIPQTVPSTPQASALGKYGDVPVGNFTGTASISVPIYTIAIKDFKLPISLSYHTGGIKVEEMATNVGLGWTLNAGGMISRLKNGLDDYLNYGFTNVLGNPQKEQPGSPISSNITFDSNYADGGNLYMFAKNVAEGLADGEPDIINYNFGSYSGKYYFDQHRQAHTIPFSNLKIEYPPTFGTNKITDENGVQYFFEAADITTTDNTCGVPSHTESIHLSKIILPDGNQIKYYFTDNTYSYPIQKADGRNRLVPGNYGAAVFECANMVDRVTVTEKRLSYIETTTGIKVQFKYNTSTRLDLPGAYSLIGIDIQYNGTPIDNFVFNQSYFGNGSRLRLDNVIRNSKEVYSFEYDNSIPIPDRLSFAQDHWGYYNGKNSNVSLLPAEPSYGFDTGANRNVDSLYTAFAILKKITYPTGGYSQLEYESNRYNFISKETVYTNHEYNLYSSANNIVTRTFTIPGSPSIITNIVAQYNAGPEMDQPCYITLTGPGGYYQQFSSPGRGLALGSLVPGTYTMSINTTGSFDPGYFTVAFKQEQTINVNEVRLLGGLRIKRQKDYDGVNDDRITRYVYNKEDSPYSSGQVNFQPQYSHRYTHCKYDPEIMNFRCTDYWKQVASSVYPLGAIKGGSVGYTMVTKLNGDNGEFGKTVYNYSFVPSTGVSETMPLVPVTDNDWLNGLLLQEKTYKYNSPGNFSLVKSAEQYYSVKDDSEYWNDHYSSSSYKSNPYLRGWGIRIIYKHPAALDGLIQRPAEFFWNDYHLNSKWQHLDSVITKDYINATDYVHSKTMYTYSPKHLLVKQQDVLTSARETFTTQFLYPQEMTGLSGGAEAARLQLIGNHQLATLLETRNLRNNLLVGKLRTNYGIWNNSMALPESVYNATTGSLEARLRYHDYDAKGNLLRVSQEKGVQINYVWSYNGQYPIAEIKNADYSTVQSVLGDAAAIKSFSDSNPTDDQVKAFLASLRTDQRLKDAQVTTYTYDPLVGMTSQTDVKGMTTYYEYDSFQRLKSIRDQNGHILKTFDYHYKP